MDKIEGFNDEFRFLSNFWPAKIFYNDEFWPNVECAYQAYKSDDPEVREEFKTLTAGEAKKKGGEIRLRDDWEVIKDSIMCELVFAKFTQNKDLGDMLLLTEDLYIEETNWWNDVYWGVCNGIGENKLGIMIMKVRHHLNDSINTFSYDLEQMKKALEGPVHVVPNNLKPGELREWITNLTLKDDDG